MNPTQKTIIFIALILFLGCGIFVPYDGVRICLIKADDNSNSFIGYFPIFSPPSSNDMALSFEKAIPRKYTDKSYKYESKINLTILVIEFFVLLILTIGLVLLFADNKNMGKPASKKE